MALSGTEIDRVLAVLDGTGHAPAYCMDHLAARAGLPPDKMDDLRTFVRGLRGEAAYTVSVGGVCDTGPHGAPGDLVIRARARLPGRSAREGEERGDP